jgi:hypothetical protein
MKSRVRATAFADDTGEASLVRCSSANGRPDGVAEGGSASDWCSWVGAPEQLGAEHADEMD